MRRVLDLFDSEPWAIDDGARLLNYRSIAAREREITLEAVEARLGRQLDNTRSVTHRDGVALIPITGPIFRYANLFTELSGATSIEELAQDFTTALNDPKIHAIIFVVDSPGGQLTGVHEFSAMVAAARGSKPIKTYAGGLDASAAYWISAATEEIVADPTASLGSLGVMAVLPDSSKSSSKELKVVSSQSPKKNLDVATEEGLAEVQKRVDAAASVFIADVAAYRGLTENEVTSRYGQGAVETGRDAVAAGLADRLGSLEGLIAELQAETRQRGVARYVPLRLAPQATTNREKEIMATQKEKESIIARVLALLGGSDANANAPAADAVSETLAAENARLKTELAEREAAAAAELKASRYREEKARIDRITAETNSFLKEYGSRMGAEFRTEFERFYRGAKLDPSASATVESLERLARAFPAPAARERVEAGGARVDAFVERVAGASDDGDPNAAHFEALARLGAAGVKQSDPDWQTRYLAALAEARRGAEADGIAA